MSRVERSTGAGPRLSKIVGHRGCTAAGVGPEQRILGHADTPDDDTDAGVVTQAGSQDRQEIHLERGVRVQGLEWRAHHQVGDERQADEGDVQRARGEADPWAPASPPQAGPDGGCDNPAHEHNGKTGDEHRSAGVTKEVECRCDEEERHREEAHPGNYELALDTGGGEGGIRW
jgi:hypothetical protein